MEKVIDTLTEKDPCVVGEIFRDYTFVGEGTGCYSDFTLRSSFKEVSIHDVDWETQLLIGGQILEEDLSYRTEFHNRAKAYWDEYAGLLVVWYWDGDGVLYFRESGVEVINYDCKKDYTWEFVENETTFTDTEYT